MTAPLASIPNVELETRWQHWLTRGAEADRHSARLMRGVIVAIALAFVVGIAIRML